ncbi:sugar ABC transporter permease [Solicola gregarius]|uniref:Xylose transport system permease protein XylH n=1 Tax=Solicola gregarius TaxID=2908642 RepID=A0AA46YKR2_9ACTN|nr:ABC transporter permease [Solicola gregarius]UYM04859.1 ABC transporter permease [Solicola gregarius]
MTVDKKTEPDTQATTESSAAFAGDARATTLGGSLTKYVERVRGGDMGALPAILGLVVLFVVFTTLRPDSFTSELNIANLLTQAAAICVLAMGLVPVLLIGDIDLSAGVAGGTSAGVAALLIDREGYAWPISVVAGIATGILIGFVIGLLVAKLGIPSFVVTLAFFLGLQGVILKLIGQGGSIAVRDGVIRGLTIDNMPVVAGWIVVGGILVAYAAGSIYTHRKKSALGLQRGPLSLVIIKLAVISVVLLGTTAFLSVDRRAVKTPATDPIQGIPYAVFVVVALLIVLSFVFGRTRYGRHVYAVGGNREAARRAGISVDRVRVSAFMVCSGMAAISGIITASYDGKVSPGSGGGNVLLYAVGAAVIGGTSLFGGRGLIRNGVIGGLVIATIANGLYLLNQAAYINFLVTGGVLLLAASVDAISRRRRTSTGT